MKITVLNGSPKGDISVTMQYIKYIQDKFKMHDLNIINVAQKLPQIEKDKDTFEDIINEIKLSDGVIWAFPLYVFTVHSNYQRFIELIFERKAQAAFEGKYTALIATSIHFFDHTAINYMNSICDDLNMKYVDYFSLEMYDLKKETVRINLLHFAADYFEAIENQVPTLRNYNVINYSPIEYIPQTTPDKIDVSNKKMVIIVDSLNNNDAKNSNLKNMIAQFRSSFSEPIELVSLDALDIKGGCLGCLKCGYNYECAYTDKDAFIEFYNSKLKTADIIIFAGAIKYRYLSASWKRFLDRGFFNTHTPSLAGKQIGFIISGPLRQIPNLKEVLEAYIQWQGSNLISFVTDEYASSLEIDSQLHLFSSKLIKAATANYLKPATFLGVGGMKIFRDEIWGSLRFPFVADHKAYKTLKVYDFPQKNYKSRVIIFIMMLMCKFPFIRKRIYSNVMKISMLMPLKKVLKK